MPSIPDAVDAMKRRGFDTSQHRSCKVTAENVGSADLILTSERDHVVRIAAASPQAYRQTMTLPEFLLLADLDDSPPGESLRDWVAGLTASRSASAYINGDVGEIVDPTGSAPRAFEKSVVGMEEMCRRATTHIVRVGEPPATVNRFTFD
ncbi:MAG: protein-tyrosine-phosphatase [Ilumatobacter sp.]|jgi:protein-tyrosine-phosphatase